MNPLSPLGDGPVPPLAPAATVRARGDQRRRRSRAALAGAGAVAVALAAVTGYVVAAPDGDRDRVRPAPLASADPVPRETASRPPVPRPSASATPAPVLEAQVLDPSAVELAVGGSWTVDGTDRQDAFPATSYYGCPGVEVPAAEAGRQRGLRSTAGPGVAHTVLRHADAATAQGVLDRWLRDVRACPERQVDSDDGTETWEAVEDLPGAGPTREYATLTYQPSCAGCDPVRSTSAVSVVGAHVSYVSTDGDPAELPALADAADRRVRGEAAPAPSTSPTTAPRSAADLLLTVEDADRAEPGAWNREGQDVEGPLLDPCTGGTDYPRDADVVDSATTVLIARREAGGTSAVQTVARYASETAARDAAQGYERAVRGCPVKQEPDADLPGNRRTHEVVEEGEVDGVPTLLVRSESTCDTCSSGYTYYAVQHDGDVVSVLLVTQGEDGDPGVDVVRPFAGEVARRLSA